MKFSPKAEHSLNPLFWQHADGHEEIREEMRRMKEAGINDFIIEPRPHPDYLGEGWWRDLDFIIRQAEELDMLIWLFDDGCYPSGVANGELARKYPQHTKRYWAENHIDAHGPFAHAHFLIDDWMREGETLYSVIAARRTDGMNELDSDTLTDITHLVVHGRLYWAIPEGDWRIFVIKITPHGMEAHTDNYVNPLSREAVGKYIELVHERHYARYPHLFGTRIQGFFTDEPRFGNISGYDCRIGSCAMPLPYADGLLEMLSGSPMGNFSCLLPLLWYEDRQGACRDARYVYMDTVSHLFAENFTGQLGEWCHAHHVRLIGHVIEENGAHARLGYGAAHYFRVMKGLDAAGIDVVNNLMPGHTEGNYSTMFNDFDCDFNHWGLAKMASSAAHADPKKKGNTLCEAFGAYGWFEGLRLMKWITDHLAVQGVNILTPHAFSPAPFPDPDCPPHFYARGENPQFRYFHVWADYAMRLMDILTDSAHIAPVAVLYHAEAEWGGKCEPFEKAVKVLAQHQIDCDVVCIDTLLDSAAKNGILYAGTESFQALVIPYAEFIPPAFADKLSAFAAAGLPIYFTNALPKRCYFGKSFQAPYAEVIPTAELPQVLKDYADISVSGSHMDLYYTHYNKQGMDIYLFVNQSTQHSIDTAVTFSDKRSALLYDAMADKSFAVPRKLRAEKNEISLHLEAWESKIIVFGSDTSGIPALRTKANRRLYQLLNESWKISIAAAKEYPHFRETPFTAMADLSLPEYLPDFSGTVRYERRFWIEHVCPLDLDLGDAYEAVTVYINDMKTAELICPPYCIDIPEALLRRGENHLVIEVTNTLVKSCHHNPYDRFFVQEPTGLIGPVILRKFDYL